VERHFDLRRQVAELRDRRRRPQVSTARVWLCVFGMFVLRLRSFNALEQELRRPQRWEGWLGAGRTPSADTLGRVLAGVSVEALRELLATLNRRAWRGKMLAARPGEIYRVVAVDGHELWASRARCCPDCLRREVATAGGPVLEYYHRVVVAQWVGVTPPAVLDIERVRPHEGEVVAARRLVGRVVERYGRLIDVITADALYLEAPFIRQVLAAGKHVVVVLKQEARQLYEEAAQVRALLAPVRTVDGRRTTQLWDLAELTAFPTLGRPVRVVWAEESTVIPRRVGGQRQEITETRRWIWVTDLAPLVVPAPTIQRWGHARWEVENRGFNELVTLWHMDHCFVHDPTALEALLLTLAVAFLLTYVFYTRNLKPAARRHLTRLAFAGRLREDLALATSSLWPAVLRSD
jgi:Transposase DDE domain